MKEMKNAEQIADYHQMSPSTVGRIAYDLRTKGIIKSQKSTYDRRIFLYDAEDEQKIVDAVLKLGKTGS